MKEYHKIQTIFKRDMEHGAALILDQYSLPEFEYLKNNKWVWTEKIDGTNIRVMWDGKDVTFGGKTDNAQIPAFLVTRLNNLFMTITQRKILHDIFFTDTTPPQICLYGEGYGAKIQKGGGNYISDGQDFILFDVKIGDWWLQREDVEEIAEKLSLKVVPILGSGTLDEAVEYTKKGFNSQWGDFLAEGLVLKPETELKSRRGDRIITKIKHKDFCAE